jgi:S-adenosylmethionine decarboxylase proenzyme, Bacillus form
MAHPPGTSLHLIADIEQCSGLDDVALVADILREAATAAGGTLIDLRLHHFGPGMGVTGVVLLAESHISIHTWPECGTAAVDLFVCGLQANAEMGLELIRKRLGGIIGLKQSIKRLAASRCIET